MAALLKINNAFVRKCMKNASIKFSDNVYCTQVNRAGIASSNMQNQTVFGDIQSLLDDAVRKINEINVVIKDAGASDNLILTQEMNSKIETIISSSHEGK